MSHIFRPVKFIDYYLMLEIEERPAILIRRNNFNKANKMKVFLFSVERYRFHLVRR